MALRVRWWVLIFSLIAHLLCLSGATIFASLAQQLHEQMSNSLSHFVGQHLPVRRGYWRLKQVELWRVVFSFFSHQHLLFVTNQDAEFLSCLQPSLPQRI